MTSCTNQLDSSTAKKADDQPFPFFSYIVRPDSVLSISVPRVEEIFLIRRNLMKMSLIFDNVSGHNETIYGDFETFGNSNPISPNMSLLKEI